MENKFNLSEKVVYNPNPKGINWVSEKNVKEFIKLLKEEINIEPLLKEIVINKIDKLAGEKLI